MFSRLKHFILILFFFFLNKNFQNNNSDSGVCIVFLPSFNLHNAEPSVLLKDGLGKIQKKKLKI